MHGKADDTDGAQPVQDALMDMLASIMRPLVTLPRWKFLHEAVCGILRRRTLVQRDIARALGETGKAPGTKITGTVVSFFARFHRFRPLCHVFYTVFTSLTRIWAFMPVACSLH